MGVVAQSRRREASSGAGEHAGLNRVPASSQRPGKVVFQAPEKVLIAQALLKHVQLLQFGVADGLQSARPIGGPNPFNDLIDPEITVHTEHERQAKRAQFSKLQTWFERNAGRSFL